MTSLCSSANVGGVSGHYLFLRIHHVPPRRDRFAARNRDAPSGRGGAGRFTMRVDASPRTARFWTRPVDGWAWPSARGVAEGSLTGAEASAVFSNTSRSSAYEVQTKKSGSSLVPALGASCSAGELRAALAS